MVPQSSGGVSAGLGSSSASGGSCSTGPQGSIIDCSDASGASYPISTLLEHLHSSILLHTKITSDNCTSNGNEFPSPINARSPVS